MTAWNIRFVLIAQCITGNAAFSLPSKWNHKQQALYATPDQWLGSSPSDHYGGAVGPQFDSFDKRTGSNGEVLSGENKAARKKTGTPEIAPLDWNGGTMEQGFSNQIKQQQKQSDKAYYPEKDLTENMKEDITPPGFVAKEQTTSEPTQYDPDVPYQIRNEVGNSLGYAAPQDGWKEKGRRSGPNISPLDWNGGTMEAGFAKAQKEKPGPYLEAPFASKSIRVEHDYSTLRQVTPPGQPKMIKPEAPKVEEKPKKEEPVAKAPVQKKAPAEPKLSIEEQQVQGSQGKQKTPPAEGFPVSKFRSTPDQPDDLFYDDVNTGAPRPQKQQQPKPKGDSFQDIGGSLEAGLGHEKEIKSKDGKLEEAFASKSIRVHPEYSTLRQVTPPGQPKMIKPEGKKSPPAEKPKEPKISASAAPTLASVQDEEELEVAQQEFEASLSPTELWKEQGREENRRPPAEGFPISQFRSTPDQPGDWFYHDVSTGSSRPAWPKN